mgnify:FL=1
MTNGKKLALSIADAADDKKAADILLLNMEKLTPMTDYFVICSARNTVQVQAIADNIEDKLAEQNIQIMHKEGFTEGKWILLDYGDCVAHVFLEAERGFYNLEQIGRAHV